MPELGNMLYLLALSYAFGQLWYNVLDYHHEGWMRVCSFPFLGIILGEALYARVLALPAGPETYGVHIFLALVATLVATVIDMFIHTLRPAHETSLRPAHA